MFQQPDRSARTGLDGFTRIVLAVVLMTTAAVVAAAVLAGVLILTTQPLAIVACVIVALFVLAWLGGIAAVWIKP